MRTQTSALAKTTAGKPASTFHHGRLKGNKDTKMSGRSASENSQPSTGAGFAFGDTAIFPPLRSRMPTLGTSGLTAETPQDQKSEEMAGKSKPGSHPVGRALNTPGQPLAPPTRAALEFTFNRDLSGVRTHTDTEAGLAAESVNARAFTFGQDIVFGPGEYAPDKVSGRRLLIHELAHTLQQGPAMMTQPLWISRSQDSSEREASGVHESLQKGYPPTLTFVAPHVARDPKPGAKNEDVEEELPAKDTLAGVIVSHILISLARKRVGFQTPVGTILGNVDTDLAVGTYELKPEPLKQRWVITKPAVKEGFRFDVRLEGANPWTLRYAETLTMEVYAGSLKEPKTFGEMHDGQGGLIDPLWLYEGTKPNPVSGPDDFESTRYDLSYRSEKGNLSKWLVVDYRDQTRKDINLDTISESTPKLWAAKQEALKVMGEYNLNFILGVFPTVFFIITITPLANIPGRYGATRRTVVKTLQNKSPELKPPEIKPPEVKGPEVKAPEIKAPEVKAPEVKVPEASKVPEAPKTGASPAIDPVQFGRDLGAKVKTLPSGKRVAIAQGVSDAKLPQADAAKATGEASKVAFGRIAEVPLSNGDTVVASVQSGPNQPIFVIKPDGKVIPARATIEPTIPLNLERPITISNIKPE